MMSKFDVPKLEELLSNFYTLTHIRIVVFDDNFVEIASYPKKLSKFCSIIRSDEVANVYCDKSDQKACKQCKKTGEPYIYQCHAGLTETVTPIKHDNIIIGYMMFGQVLMNENKNDSWKIIYDQCKEYHIDLKLLETAFNKCKFININQIKSAAKILEACAGYLWLSKLATLNEDNLSKKIEEYIGLHIKESLTAVEICDALMISKSMLYKLSEHSYEMGIAEYIRKRRIEMAKSFLEKEEYSIAEIAVEVGLDDYNYFSKIFKKHTGLTPSQYRKKL